MSETSTSTTVTIQPAQGDTVGEYDPRKTLPYPWHIRLDGTVARQEFWRGDPVSLCGFQKGRDTQTVDLFDFDWLADLEHADRVIGMFPVFMRADGSMWNSTHPIESVTVNQAVSA